MSMRFSNRAIMAVWLVVFGLFALVESPMTFARGVVLLLVAGAALTIMLAVWKGLHSAGAAVAVPRTPLVTSPTLPPGAFVPNSWPNSGFRNSRRRGTSGA
jgi:hypothetical protein